jgi:hypothetical protein
MMRRIVLVVTVALVMAAMMVATAMPAFADHSHSLGHTIGETHKSFAKACQGTQDRPGASECHWTQAPAKAQGPK